MLEQYWETIVAASSGIGVILVAGVIKWVKSKLANSIVGTTATSIKESIGTENYNQLITMIKSFGIQKTTEKLTELVNDLKEVKTIIPLLIAQSQIQLDMGLYDETPVLKEIVETTLNNVK